MIYNKLTIHNEDIKCTYNVYNILQLIVYYNVYNLLQLTVYVYTMHVIYYN